MKAAKIRKKISRLFSKSWFISIWLILLPPLGIVLLWTASKSKKSYKALLTAIATIWFIPLSISVYDLDPIYLIFGSSHDYETEKFKIILDRSGRYIRAHLKDEIVLQETSKSSKTLTITEIAQKWKKSIVNIKVTGPDHSLFGSGSGFIVSKNGIILTNAHVIDSAPEVMVVFPAEKKTYRNVFLIDADTELDIAFLHIQEKNVIFHPVILGDSDKVQVGEEVVSIGSPIWPNLTVVEGIISVKKEFYSDDLLTTIPTFPGFSGGALFNLKGEVIGITTGRYEDTSINISIPINKVKEYILDKEPKYYKSK